MAKPLHLVKERQSEKDDVNSLQFSFIYLLIVSRSLGRLLTLISHGRYLTLLEVQFLESEVSLHNASGLDPSSQHILLRGDIV